MNCVFKRLLKRRLCSCFAFNVTDKPTVIIKNPFPYHVHEDISHWNLWSISELVETDYRSFIDRKFPAQEFDVLVMENPTSLKSVKTVYHLHIFVRKRTHD